ncbi:MAG: hypothetical protein ABSF48_25940, partial [Thermodesulfobacteriota bacterium]
VCGLIEYHTPLGLSPLPHSLTSHPYLENAGIKVLNITLEATDRQGHVFRYMNVSLDQSTDSFRLITAAGVKYVGLDPYGTEFAGLPSVAAAYPLSVNVWVTGYLQSVSELVNKAVREALAEDAEDIAAFEERAGERLIAYDEMVKRLKKDGRI